MGKSKPQFDVITVGGIVRDTSYYNAAGRMISTPQNLTAQKWLAFEYGAKIAMKDVVFSMGGGASNVAVGLHRLGYRTSIISRIGKDPIGQEVSEHFKKEKVDTTFLQVDAQRHTGMSFIISTDAREREHVIFLYRGANEGLEVSSKMIDSVRPRWWYVSSLSGERWQKNLETLFAHKKKYGGKIAWNPGRVQLQAGKKTLAPFLQKTDVLILNKDEAIELVLSGITLGRRNPKFVNNPLYLQQVLSDWGAKYVVITQGNKGASGFDGKKSHRQPVLKSKVVDTCGVGDAFGAGVVGSLLQNPTDLATALRWGAITASGVATKPGAQGGLVSRKALLAKLH